MSGFWTEPKKGHNRTGQARGSENKDRGAAPPPYPRRPAPGHMSTCETPAPRAGARRPARGGPALARDGSMTCACAARPRSRRPDARATYAQPRPICACPQRCASAPTAASATAVGLPQIDPRVQGLDPDCCRRRWVQRGARPPHWAAATGPGPTRRRSGGLAPRLRAEPNAMRRAGDTGR